METQAVGTGLDSGVILQRFRQFERSIEIQGDGSYKRFAHNGRQVAPVGLGRLDEQFGPSSGVVAARFLKHGLNFTAKRTRHLC